MVNKSQERFLHYPGMAYRGDRGTVHHPRPGHPAHRGAEDDDDDLSAAFADTARRVTHELIHLLPGATSPTRLCLPNHSRRPIPLTVIDAGPGCAST